MSEFLDAVKRARQGDRPTLDGFGLERVALASDQWRDAFTIDGAGRGVRTTLRTIDARPVGEFAGTVLETDVGRLLEVIERTPFDALKPAHAEPYAMRVELSIVIGGAEHRWQMPAAPEAHKPVTQLLGEIDRLAGIVSRHPVATLEATLALDPLPPAADGCGVTIELRNGGTDGTWIVNPTVLGPIDDKPSDHLVVRYGRQLPPDPGANPPQIIFDSQDVVLQNAPLDRYLWIAGGAALVLRGKAALTLRSARYRMHAVYASYSCPTRVAGRRLFRGRVVSPDAVVEVA